MTHETGGLLVEGDKPFWGGDCWVPYRDWVVQDLIPSWNVTLLTGDGGTGKSLLCLQLLVAAALGRPWLGHPTGLLGEDGGNYPCPVLGVFCEDDYNELHRRTVDVVNHYGAELGDLGYLNLMHGVTRNNLLMEFPGPFERGETTAFFKRVADTAVKHEVQLIVLDSLDHLFAGNENDPSHVRQFVQALRGLAWDMSGAVLLTAHPSVLGCNSGTDEPGSTAWSDAARSWLHLHKPKADGGEDVDPDERVLTHMKSNYSRSGTQIPLRWESGPRAAVPPLGTDPDLGEGLVRGTAGFFSNGGGVFRLRRNLSL